MTEPKVASVSSSSRAKANRTLAEVRKLKPTQVVVWYQSEDGQTGVALSEGTERTKAVGGLSAAAMDVWNT